MCELIIKQTVFTNQKYGTEEIQTVLINRMKIFDNILPLLVVITWRKYFLNTKLGIEEHCSNQSVFQDNYD